MAEGAAGKRWPKRVLAAVSQWDYGDPNRGSSCEDAFFVTALRDVVEHVDTLWIDEWLNQPEALAEAVLTAVTATRPDLTFFVPMRNEVSAELLQRLKGRTQTMAWFGDDQWRFSSFSQRLAPQFDHVVTTAPGRMTDYRSIGVEAILSQWAAVAPVGLPGPANEEQMVRDAAFVGGATLYRRWFVDQLAKRGVSVQCWGAGWPAGRLSFDDVNEVFRTSRINLNLSNSVSHDIRYVLSGPRAIRDYLRSGKRSEQPKARHFEICVAGGFQLTNYFPGLEDYLRIGEEVTVYTSVDDCAEQMKHYLGDVSRRRDIAQQGFTRCVNEHTYVHRIRDLISAVFGPLA